MPEHNPVLRWVATVAVCLWLGGAAGPATVEAQRPSRFDASVAAFIAFDTSSVAITGATLIDGSGGPPRRGITILIRDGRFTAVGRDGEVRVPSDARQVDARGMSVVPGMVFMHEHLFYPTGGPGEAIYNPQFISFPRLYLAFGITTARTAGSVNFDGELTLKRYIDAGMSVGPRLVLYAPYINGPVPGKFVYQWTAVDGVDDVKRRVEFYSGLGAAGFKAYEHLTRAELGALIASAHARGLKVTGHLCSVTWPEAVALGIDNLEHGLMVNSGLVASKREDECPGDLAMMTAAARVPLDGATVRDLTAELVRRGTAVTSTPTIWESFTGSPEVLSGRAQASLVPQLLEEYERSRQALAARRDSSVVHMLQNELRWERDYYRAGGHLLVGTDPTGYGGIIAGFGSMRALELLASSGLRVEEVIEIATMHGARFLGLEAELGSITPGKRADLLLVPGDLALDLTALRRPHLVFKDGVAFDSERLINSTRGLVGLR